MASMDRETFEKMAKSLGIDLTARSEIVGDAEDGPDDESPAFIFGPGLVIRTDECVLPDPFTILGPSLADPDTVYLDETVTVYEHEDETVYVREDGTEIRIPR